MSDTNILLGTAVCPKCKGTLAFIVSTDVLVMAEKCGSCKIFIKFVVAQNKELQNMSNYDAYRKLLGWPLLDKK